MKFIAKLNKDIKYLEVKKSQLEAKYKHITVGPGNIRGTVLKQINEELEELKSKREGALKFINKRKDKENVFKLKKPVYKKVEKGRTSFGEGKKYLSNSQIGMYLRCSMQYYYRYIMGLKIPPNGAMMQSVVWHSTVEKNYNQKKESKIDLPTSEMQEFYSAEYDKTFGEQEITLAAGQTLGKLKDQGIDITRIHHKEIAPKVHPVLVEEKFRLDFGENFPYDLVGIWDVVDEDGMVADNKAYSKTPSQSGLDTDLQLTLYSLAYRMSQKKIEKGLRIDAVVKNTKLKCVQVSTTRTTADLNWVVGLLDRVANGIEKEVFLPNPTGWLCSKRWCGFYSMCHRENINKRLVVDMCQAKDEWKKV